MEVRWSRRTCPLSPPSDSYRDGMELRGTGRFAIAMAATTIVGLLAWNTVTASAASAAAETGTATTHSTIVTIGDSIMAGHGLSDPGSTAWPVLLGEATGTSVTNDSCSGAGFIAVGSCGTDFAGLIPAAVDAAPDLVVVESSDNDEGEDPVALAAATMATVKALHAALPHAWIVGLSTLWDQPGGTPAEVRQSSTDLERAVDVVGGTYIDVGQPIAGRAGLLQSDDEHPTVIGQQVLAVSLMDDLRAARVLR